MVDRGNVERLVGRSGGGRGGGGAHVVALFGSATAMVGKHIRVSESTTISFAVGLLEINGNAHNPAVNVTTVSLSVRRMSELEVLS